MDAIVLAGAILALAVLFVALPTGRHMYGRLRGPRVVVCPETNEATEIEVDAKLAAISEALGRKPELRVQRCERWSDGHACDEACLRGMDEAAIAGAAMPSRQEAGAAAH